MSVVSVWYFLPASSEAWLPGVMWTSIWVETHTAFRREHKNKTHRYPTRCLYQLMINPRRWGVKCASPASTHMHILWTCPAGSEAAWLWLTDRWVLPCCSGGSWEWTRYPQCSLHHSPEQKQRQTEGGLINTNLIKS